MMKTRSGALAVLTLLVLCTPAWAAPVTVQLRVEGASATLFEGPVTTDGKPITKDGSGPHPCDGTNGGANPGPGPTITSALDDGQQVGGYTWDGTWFTFGDFGVNRIGPDAQTATQFWGYTLNYTQVMVGGCQVRVTDNDQVLFAYDLFSKQHLLKLTGPSAASVGQPVTVKVVDGATDSPLPNVSVAGATTGADGTAQVTFESVGVRRIKAARADSIRSNALSIAVGTGTATAQAAGDRIAPVVSLSSIRSRARYRRGPRLIAGSASDSGGLLQAYFRLRRTARGGCSWYSAKRERFTRPGHCRSARFNRVGDRSSFSYLLPARLPRGRYVLEVKALDRALNVGRRRISFRVR